MYIQKRQQGAYLAYNTKELLGLSHVPTSQLVTCCYVNILDEYYIVIYCSFCLFVLATIFYCFSCKPIMILSFQFTLLCQDDILVGLLHLKAVSMPITSYTRPVSSPNLDL